MSTIPIIRPFLGPEEAAAAGEAIFLDSASSALKRSAKY